MSTVTEGMEGDEKPVNVDPPTPEELVKASAKLGDPQSKKTKQEIPRPELLTKLRPELEAMYTEVKNCVQVGDFAKARTILNKAWFHEDQIATLERFPTEEDQRAWLLNQVANGYR